MLQSARSVPLSGAQSRRGRTCPMALRHMELQKTASRLDAYLEGAVLAELRGRQLRHPVGLRSGFDSRRGGCSDNHRRSTVTSLGRTA